MRSLVRRAGCGAVRGAAPQAFSPNNNTPSFESYSIGFRVASVPEPSAHLLTVLSVSVLLIRRRRSTL
jgi:hypothetical protein